MEFTFKPAEGEEVEVECDAKENLLEVAQSNDVEIKSKISFEIELQVVVEVVALAVNASLCSLKTSLTNFLSPVKLRQSF